ncbi:replicative DNA helicase [Methylobacterium sp. Leaf106]|uniref:replicative DNA helicase n=1 Tax=Methylobacterium sp. Leaf106 TaxID=1736255 RepID=UPI0007017E81|nr:replicative DNA helicase [Methylobacterium sp. Leaf106]KQP53055.1 hypothetical protein ASF34_01410 [Methylobacterium sp. Leaf106]
MSGYAHPGAEAPPNAIEAEQGLIGAVLHNPDILDRVREYVRAEDFAEDVNRHIFETMCQRRDVGETIDFKLMKAVLGNADLGGATVGQYLGRLVAEATTVSGAPGYARLIAQAAQMRRVLETCQAGTAAMMAGAVASPADYAAQMIEDLDEVATSALSSGLRRTSIGQSVQSVITRVDNARAGRVITGAPYGLPSLDRATLGMRENQLIILAGRPGMGKTATAIHIGMSSARIAGAVGFVSLEMGADELAERVLASAAYNPREFDEISYRSIAEARGLSRVAMERLRRAADECADIPLWIEQQPGLTISQISARARQMKMRAERMGMPFAALVVDHIGLIRPSKRYAGNRVQEITEISAALKGLAKELGSPVVALSQLNRSVESREDKRPVLSDLRDSGSIEQDADVVIGLFREAYYLERKVERTDEETDRLCHRRNVLEIEILKQRSGPTVRIDCFCDIACNVLAEMAQ